MRLRAGRAAGAGELTRSRGHGVSTARGQAGRGLAGSARRVRRTQMRKILLGTTAVVGAALLAPEMAAAQQAPTVRIGGYFRAYYGYTQQTSPHITGTTPQGSVNQVVGPGAGDTFPTFPAAGPTAPTIVTGPQSARTSKNDFSTDAEVHVFVNGKTANGLSYGAVVEIQFDNSEGTVRAARRSYNSKTSADIDEMYAFIASPTL